MIDLRQIILIKLYYIYILSTNSYKDREAKWLLIFFIINYATCSCKIETHFVIFNDFLSFIKLFLMISLPS